MSVAVIIVNYQSDELLLKCLDAVSIQTLTPQAVVVVDNHEEREATIGFKQRFPQVQFISTGSNIGFAAATNLGVSQVHDLEFFALLNPDAFPEKNWLEELISAAEKNPSCGSFASLMLSADNPEYLDGFGDTLHFSGLPWRVGHGQLKQSFPLEKAGRFSACGGASLYRSTAWREVGGFDESYFMYIEDVDLGFRLQLLGYSCCVVPTAVVQHMGSAISGYHSDFSIYYGHRNLVWNYFKNMPWQLLLITLPFHLLMNIATIMIFILKGRGRVMLKSKRDAVLGLPQALKCRFSVSRKVPVSFIWRLLNKSLFLGKK